jgi:hypothetical protein
VGDDVEEISVNVPPAVVVNEAQFASVKDEALQLPERLDWRCAPLVRLKARFRRRSLLLVLLDHLC